MPFHFPAFLCQCSALCFVHSPILGQGRPVRQHVETVLWEDEDAWHVTVMPCHSHCTTQAKDVTRHASGCLLSPCSGPLQGPASSSPSFAFSSSSSSSSSLSSSSPSSYSPASPFSPSMYLNSTCTSSSCDHGSLPPPPGKAQTSHLDKRGLA